MKLKAILREIDTSALTLIEKNYFKSADRVTQQWPWFNQKFDAWNVQIVSESTQSAIQASCERNAVLSIMKFWAILREIDASAWNLRGKNYLKSADSLTQQWPWFNLSFDAWNVQIHKESTQSAYQASCEGSAVLSIMKFGAILREIHASARNLREKNYLKSADIHFLNNGRDST